MYFIIGLPDIINVDNVNKPPINVANNTIITCQKFVI